jgi:hypothetical protein
MSATTERARRYRVLTDSQLAHVLSVLEREAEVLADATWPAAGIRRADLEAAITAARAEIERRAV